MKVLVGIANYGTKNDHYLAQLLAEYRAMPYDVHIVVLSNVAKNVGADVEVVVGLPDEKNPFSLPFAHRQLFADRRDAYDLYIYSEDDTLLRRHNVESFLKAANVLPANEIAGFVRFETDPQGQVYYSTVHNHYHWDPSSVRHVGGMAFAHFTNEHAACFILTREQLNKAIQSGGFLVAPHEGRYGILEAAATDPYTQCGFRKMICISQLDEASLPHLPNKYLGKLGLPKRDFELQVDVLRGLTEHSQCSALPFGHETRLPQGRWSKGYYEPASEMLQALVSSSAQSVLSIGCGLGNLEAELAKRGAKVAAMPLDCVIAACARARGVEMIDARQNGDFPDLQGRTFDCVVLSNLLHLVPNPSEYLSRASRFLSAAGSLLVRVPNVGGVPVWKSRLSGKNGFAHLADFEKSGVHVTSPQKVHEWMRQSGLQVAEFRTVSRGRAQMAGKLVLGLADSLLAEEFYAVGTRVAGAR